MSRRIIAILGTAGAVGGTYYLYQSGGNPDTLQKQLESDASRLSAKVKGEEKKAETQTSRSAQEAGAKLDSAFADAKKRGNELSGQINDYAKDAEKRLDQDRKDAGKGLLGAVDKFDRNVEKGAGKVTQSVSDGADKAKSSIWSWFGGGK